MDTYTNRNQYTPNKSLRSGIMKKVLFTFALFTLVTLTIAADVDVYGKLRLGTWWVRSERFFDDSIGLIFDTSSNNSIDTSVNYASDSLSPFYDNTFVPSGYAGVLFKANQFEGCVEFAVLYSLYDVELHGNTTTRYILQKRKYAPIVNKWFATWHMTDMLSLKFGQDYTPTTTLKSNKALWYELEYANIGAIYSEPKPMFELSIHDPNSSLFECKVAAVKTDTFLFLDDNLLYDHTGETKVPKLELSVSGGFEGDIFGINGKLVGGFQRYSNVTFNPEKVKDSVRTDVDCFVFGADVGMKLGMVGLQVNMFTGQNMGPYGILVGDPFGFHQLDPYMQVYFPKDTQVHDTMPWEFFNSKATQLGVAAIIKPTEWLKVEGGFGMALGNHEFKAWKDMWETTISWYIQSELKIFEQLLVTPELGQYNYGPRIGFGRRLYWGCLIGVDF